jgi:hypothetical protein
MLKFLLRLTTAGLKLCLTLSLLLLAWTLIAGFIWFVVDNADKFI